MSYIEREAAFNAILNLVPKVDDDGYCWVIRGDAARAIDSIHAADVRPVVLCRDCVYAYPYGLEIKCTKHSGRADRFGEDATYSEFHDESWFCADGEKRKHE